MKKAIRKDSKGQERFEDYFSDSEEEEASKNDQSADAAPAAPAAPADKTAEKPTEDESMEVDEAKSAKEPKEPEKEKETEKEGKKAPEDEYEEWKKKSLKGGEKEAEQPKEKEDSNSAPKEKETKIITAKKSTAPVPVTMAAAEEDEGETMEDIENFISKDAAADGADAQESPANKVMGQVRLRGHDWSHELPNREIYLIERLVILEMTRTITNFRYS